MFDLLNRRKLPRAANGYALVLALLALVTVGATSLLIAIGRDDQSNRRLTDSAMAADVLMRAREAIIGYSVAQLSGGDRPGQMLTPDTLANANYNGKPDLGCLDAARINGLPELKDDAAKSANLRCLGRLPWQPLGLDLGTTSPVDPLGMVPWYAVSQNLADPNLCMEVLNSQTASRAVAGYTACPKTTEPAWPWLKVCDATGRIISNRVAFVLIMPGTPLSTQGRTQARPASLGAPADFLDAIPIPASWASLPATSRCNKLDNAGLTDEYVIGDINASFNDRLVYVTIDELMEAVERRVATELREAILRFRGDTDGLPWLAPLADPTTPETATLAVPGTASGLIPFVAPKGPSSSSNDFRTEMEWAITPSVGSPSFGGPTSSTTTFLCYGGVYQCQIRQPNGAFVPRTITPSNLQSASVNLPIVNCTYAYSGGKINSATCDPTTTIVSTPVNYSVWRRLRNSTGSFSPIVASVAGTQRRTITTASITAAGTVVLLEAAASKSASRKITTNSSQSLGELVLMSDVWTPSAIGVAPFDVSSGPYLPTNWTGETGGTGRITLTTRAHPDLPSWYLTQKWYELAYAAMSPDSVPNAVSGQSATCSANCFSVGARRNIDAVVIVAGPQLAALTQNRYRANPVATDFLEALNATGTSSRTFAAEKQPRTTIYADTIATIPR